MLTKIIELPARRKRYELKEIIGVGTAGTVYNGTEISTALGITRSVVVKEFRKGGDESNDDFKERYTREYALSLYLRQQPSVCTLNAVCAYDSFSLGRSRAFLVFPFTSGINLAQYIDKFHHAVQEGSAAQRRQLYVVGVHIAMRIMNAVGQLHAVNVVHQDIKAQNVVVSAPKDDPLVVDDLRLIDFGLSCTEGADEILTMLGFGSASLTCGKGEENEFYYETTPNYQDPHSMLNPYGGYVDANYRRYPRETFRSAFKRFDIYAAAVTIQYLFDYHQWAAIGQYRFVEFRQVSWLDMFDNDLLNLLLEMSGPLDARRSALRYALEFEKLKRRLELRQ